MKVESLVIVDQHATVNMFPGLVHTARQGLKVGLVLSFSIKKNFKLINYATHGCFLSVLFF